MKNGKKPNGKQNYLCKNEGCGRQFIGDHNLTYKGCHSNINRKITLMLVRGVGIRDISKIEEVSTGKVLTVLVKSSYSITPKRSIMTILKLMNFGLMFRKKRTNNSLYMLMTEKHGKL